MSESSASEYRAALEGLIEHWFFETFHGSSVARSTEAWNVAHAAKEELKRRLVHFVVRAADDTPRDRSRED